MNRIQRISAILVQLQSRQIVTCKQIADSFQVSLRTIYRDIRVLEEIGIPIIGDAGVGYSLVDGYKLAPLMFTKEEALAFLTAEKAIEKLTDFQNVQSFNTGMNKIKSLLRYVEKDYISHAEQNISVMGRSIESSKLPFAITQVILQSIIEKKQIHISYISTDKTRSIRNIEPVGCFYSRLNWYLIAFCNSRLEYRNFRVDRIENYKQISLSFTKDHPTLAEYVKIYHQQKEVSEVVIRLKTADMYSFDDSRYYHGWMEEKEINEYTYIYFKIFDLDHFARWYLSFAHVGEILQPDSLKFKIKEILNKLFESYAI